MSPGDATLGLACYADVKSPGGGRKPRAVKVIWVSEDGFVTEVETTKGTPRREAFAVGRLRSER